MLILGIEMLNIVNKCSLEIFLVKISNPEVQNEMHDSSVLEEITGYIWEYLSVLAG